MTAAPARRRRTTLAKFGGSSLATTDQVRRAAQRMATAHAAGDRVVVVVSARGDATDRLIETAAHLAGAADGELAAHPRRARELDHLLATGENASAAQLALALLSLGVDAVSMTAAQACITAVGAAGAGRIEGIDTTAIERHLEAGRVVVVAGFHGMDASGDVVTLGRGGSDTTAVALAVALGANRCDIFTDVPGIFTADPRVVPTAAVIPRVPAEVVAEMAHAGARVMHARAVDLAAAHGVDLHVLHASTGDGSVIVAERKPDMLESASLVHAVAHDDDVALVLVDSELDPLETLLEPLSAGGVPIDLAARLPTGPTSCLTGFTIAADDVARLRSVVGESGPDHTVEISEGLATVSAIGTGLLGGSHASRALGCLRRYGVPVPWVSMTSSRLSVVVPRLAATVAVNALHREFALAGHPVVETPA